MSIASPSAVRSADRLAADRSSIVALLDDEGVVVEFVGMNECPYSSASAPTLMAVWQDANKNREFWLDAETSRVIQFGPFARPGSALPDVTPQRRLPVAELRAVAVALMERSCPAFSAIRPSLHPLEDNRRRQVYFFRFDDFDRTVGDDCLPPFVQVAVRADGLVIAYTDTLSFPAASRSAA